MSPDPDRTGLKIALAFELFFAYIFSALTAGLFILYLTVLGYGVHGVSLAVLAASLAASVVNLLVFIREEILATRLRPKLLALHALSRLIWFLIPLVRSLGPLLLLFAVHTMTSSVVGTMMQLVIFGSFDESEVREVTGLRSAAGGIGAVLGTLLALLIVSMPSEAKYTLAFWLGASVGLISTAIMASQNLSHLENLPPARKEAPEIAFSGALYYVMLIMLGGLLGVAWTPYLVDQLKAPESLVVAASLVGTVASIGASIFWRGRSFHAMRASIGMVALTPILVILARVPILHLPLMAYYSFAYTGASMLGVFLFARYRESLGIVRSAALVNLSGGFAQALAGFVGMMIGSPPPVLISSLIAAAGALAIASLAIPETAFVPEEVARMYSAIMYRASLTGFMIALEFSRETVMLMLRMISLSLALMILYIVYRILLALMLVR